MVTLRLLRSDSEPTSVQPRHRTADIERAYIEGYPTRLWIYRLQASRFWWVRYYTAGRTLKQSTRQTGRREALEFARQFYQTVNRNQELGLLETSATNFRVVALTVLAAERAKLDRGEITRTTYDIFDYRFAKSILPFFGGRDVADVRYAALEEYVTHLSNQGVSSATLSSYLQLVRKVLKHASRRDLITAVPEFPSVKVKSKPRGWFTPAEYLRLWRSARQLSGTRMEIRKYTSADGQRQTQYVASTGQHKLGRRMRYVSMTQDVVRLIEFMVNAYIRPTDIKHMRHQHVEIVRGQYTYLRLRLPESKGHTDPITTMPRAVTTYLKLRAEQVERRQGRPLVAEDYVFVPEHASRDHALQLLQHQFEIVLEATGLRHDVHGEFRSLYSLRHSSIMYRLLYGDGINTLVLARNARTSVEMIDRFYARPLSGEMNIDMLQSKRRRRGGQR